MKKPIQFSVRQLFMATAPFGTAAALFRAAIMSIQPVQSFGEVCISYWLLYGGIAAFIAGGLAILDPDLQRALRSIGVILLLGFGSFLMILLSYRR
jgi:hypothetical protein